MGPATIALIVYILLIVIWATLVKRNMSEGMLLGLIVVALFSRSDFFKVIYAGIVAAITNEVLFASLAFILMSYLIKTSGMLNGILKIFDSLLGNLRGGPAFVNIALSAVMGMLSGSNSANTATSGTFTAQWMIETGWKKETAATLIAGNGGLGSGFPPSASMFIMLNFAAVSQLITEGQLYIGLFVAGTYQVIYRIILVLFLIKKGNIQASKKPNNNTWTILKQNWYSLLVFLGAIIPILITVGPIGHFLENRNYGRFVDDISLLTWIPMLMIFIILIVGHKELKKNIPNRQVLINDLFPQYVSVGGVLLFAFAASEVFNQLGLADELILLFESLNFSKGVMVLLVGLLVVLVAGPLSSTATLTSIGLIAFSGLISVGVTPLAAVVAILTFASTEGASPPASGSIFIASGLTESSPEKTFLPLILYFVLPITGIGWLIAMGYLPLFS